LLIKPAERPESVKKPLFGRFFSPLFHFYLLTMYLFTVLRKGKLMIFEVFLLGVGVFLLGVEVFLLGIEVFYPGVGVFLLGVGVF
jgi:hypothetical protein